MEANGKFSEEVFLCERVPVWREVDGVRTLTVSTSRWVTEVPLRRCWQWLGEHQIHWYD